MTFLLIWFLFHVVVPIQGVSGDNGEDGAAGEPGDLVSYSLMCW